MQAKFDIFQPIPLLLPTLAGGLGAHASKYMIDEVLNKLRDTINGFIGLQTGAIAVLGDIAQHESQAENAENLDRSIVITLINIEEENTLKNNYPVRIQNNISIQEKPVLHLNLYLLFTAKYDVYMMALKHIGAVMMFFQANTRLSLEFGDGQKGDFVFTLHNIGFENLNNLWTVLGGKYMPSVIYKLRLVWYQASPPVGGPAIVAISESEN